MIVSVDGEEKGKLGGTQRVGISGDEPQDVPGSRTGEFGGHADGCSVRDVDAGQVFLIPLQPWSGLGRSLCRRRGAVVTAGP